MKSHKIKIKISLLLPLKLDWKALFVCNERMSLLITSPTSLELPQGQRGTLEMSPPVWRILIAGTE
jgi:hypothetical protein